MGNRMRLAEVVLVASMAGVIGCGPPPYVGTWRGTLSNCQVPQLEGETMDVTFIDEGNGEFSGFIDSTDGELDFTSTELDGSTVKAVVDRGDGNGFVIEVEPEGSTLEGEFTVIVQTDSGQGNMKCDVVFRKR